MPTTRRNTLLTTLMISIFLGFMLATTGGFFIPRLRMLAAPLYAMASWSSACPSIRTRPSLRSSA